MNEKFAQWVRGFCEENQLTLKDIAEGIGYTYHGFNHILQGRATLRWETINCVVMHLSKATKQPERRLMLSVIDHMKGWE
jgi:predicted transcriptional regulator